MIFAGVLKLKRHDNIIPEQVFINFFVVLDWHSNKCYNFATVTISCTDMCDPIHHQLFILVYMHFVTKVVSRIRNWIQLSGS